MTAHRFALAGFLLLATTLSSRAQDGGVPLAGDALRTLGFEDQRYVQIAAGGPGYLVVWEDQRTVLGPYVDAGYENLLGNQRDIYAARLDAAGNLLDPDPIVVCNLGRNQEKPQVAWNGSKWLVVFTSERPDWYFFQDILGVRIGRDGAVLDASPIAIRPQLDQPANNYGQTPSVLGRDGDFVVVWEDWNPANFFPNLKGTRVSDAGVVLDPNWPTLHEHNVAAFGPRLPRVVPLGNDLLLTWLELNSGPRFRVLSATLAPLTPPVLLTGGSQSATPWSASDGQTGIVLSGLEAWRIGAGGAVLDPTGITVSNSPFGFESHPKVAWNGQSFAVTFSSAPGGSLFLPSDVFVVRVGANGQVLDPNPIAAAATGLDERQSAIAGEGGVTQVVHLTRSGAAQEDVRAANVSTAGVPAAPVEVSTGMSRQEFAEVASDGEFLAVAFVSRRSDQARVMLQRLAADGAPVDAEPIVVAELPELAAVRPDVAFDGNRYLVVWNDATNAVVARRFERDLTPLDAQPIPLFANTGAPTVAGRDGIFLVATTVIFSGDQNTLQARRIDDAGTILGPSFLLGGGWVEKPTLESFGSGWLAAWTRRPTHDSPSSAVRARLVGLDGSVAAPDFQVSAGRGIDPDLAIAGDRALVVWTDDSDLNDEKIEARILLANGTLPSPEFLVIDQENHQSFPAATHDGSQFLVTWVDYRSNGIVDQHRGDVFGSRISYAGAVKDPDGVPITSSSLPEELPKAILVEGIPRVFWLDLRAAEGSPHVYRIVHRSLADLLPGAWKNLGFGKAGVAGEPVLTGSGEPVTGNPISIVLERGAPNAPAFLVIGGSRVDLPFFGGTLVPAPSIVSPLTLSPLGGFTLALPWPAIPPTFGAYLQVWIQDPAASFGLAASNGLEIDA
jgi:hypothetical protein